VPNLASILTAIISAISAIISIYLTNRNSKELQKSEFIYQNKIKELELTHSERLRKLESELTRERDEESAIREYEYDARKRLYQEYEPLLFQFNELADNALRRIIALARESRGGKLEKDISWLSGSRYYFDSTIYRLLIPFAIFNLMQKKLTMFDLKLNPFFNQQYLLIKLLYHTFSHDIRLANIEPNIPEYDPNSVTKVNSNYKKQGIFIGIVDNLTNELIIKEGENLRIMTFGEFSNYISDSLKNMQFKAVFEIFKDFHPARCPVLWRILMVQAYVYRAILINYDKHYKKESIDIKKTLSSISSNWRSKFDWRQGKEREKIADKSVFDDPFNAAEIYLNKRMEELKLHKGLASSSYI